MKKTWFSLTFSLILVLALSFVGAKFLLPLLTSKTYSQTDCLTDKVTESMDLYDIAKLYRDNRATVAVIVTGKNNVDNQTYQSLGSGVCVASKGYTTSSLDSNYTANMGSYVVTNYHVIDMFYSNDFTNQSVVIMPEEEKTYECELLWSNKDLDVAVLYCDDTNLNYVRMEDRVIFCEQENRLDIEEIFTIGTPLDLSYLNRFTKGEVASNNPMYLPNAEYIYTYSSNDEMKYSNYYQTGSTATAVLCNMYEDVVDITVGITNGNSGGGCFDGDGILVGLTTLGLGVSSTGGNQMNGIVPIYPIIEVIDKLISNNERSTSLSIYTLETMGVQGIDAYEAAYANYFQEDSNLNYYFLDGEFYSTSTYYDDFLFSSDGYYILSNASSNNFSSLGRGTVITACQINGENQIDIIDRNDLVYALLQIDDGDKVIFTYEGLLFPLTLTVQF